MRIVDFFDGMQSETTPTIGNIKASGLIEYADDATYEANEQGAPAEGNIYFNTTSKLIRYYNGTEWIDVVDRKTAQALDNKTIDGSSTGTNTIKTIADNVEVTPTGNLLSINTQDALEELQGDIDLHETRIDDLETDVADLFLNKEDKVNKGVANGYAPLDGSNLIPSMHLPSYVDDVLEYANLAAFPVTGETGKIYVAIDTNTQYRWSGSSYIDISSGVDTVNGQTGAVVLDLDDVNDVNAPSPADNDVLTYDTGTSEWVNASVPRALDALSDVDTTTVPPVSNDFLKYNGSQWVPAPVAVTLLAPTVQKFTSGSGTYTLPTSPAPMYIRVVAVGGGGGGGGSGSGGGTAGSVGGNTTFGTSLISANGGGGGTFQASGGGAGGSASLGVGPVGIAITGGGGESGNNQNQSNQTQSGGVGGNSALGGGARSTVYNSAGTSGAANTGGGGSGGGSNNVIGVGSGSGGGSGGYVDAIIYTPSSTYSFSVGVGGSAGTAGTSGLTGGAGGSGVIIVYEHYQ